MESCLIVGGGLIGMLTAKELVDVGVNVTVIDRRAVGGESSWAGGGILSPLYPWRYDDAINHLAKWSQQYYPKLCQQLHTETGIDPQLTVSGLLMLNVDDHELAGSWAGRFDATLVDVPCQVLKEQEPLLSDGPWQNVLSMSGVGQVRNPWLLSSLKTWLVTNGVKFLEHQPVSSISVENNCIRGVEVEGHHIVAERVVVAGGAWSKGILASAGVELGVFPVQGQMLLFKGEPGLIKHIIMLDGFYIIPRQDGHILVGSTMEYRGFDKQTTDEAYVHLKQFAISLLPELINVPVVKHWAGLRPGSKKGIPWIGAVPSIEGLYVNTGHFRNGVVMGPATARLLVDIMTARAPIVDPSQYHLV